MLTVVDIESIRKKFFVEEWSIRKIARQLEVSRQSVRKALKSAEPWEYTLHGPRACPAMDPYRKVIVDWLKADQDAPRKQRHTAKRIYDRLQDEHEFTGGESTVRRYVARLRREFEGPKAEPYFVLSAQPGEMAQVDWGECHVHVRGVRTRIYLFCFRLRHSHVPFVWAALHERMEAFLEGHVRAFASLGGVPKELVYDNLTTAVQKVMAGHDRVLQERFVTLRSHYLFESVFCNPASGHEKGSVEHLVGYVRRNALTPIPAVDSIQELNDLLLVWCEKDRDKHAKEWAEEQGALRALPEGAFKPCISTILSVNKLSLITYQRNRYSVPTECIGENVRVDVYTDRLEVWMREKRVAEHARQLGRNQTSLRLEHYLDALERKPYAVHHATVVRELPEPYQEARHRLCSTDPSGYREMVRILLLHREFPDKAIREAVANRVATGNLSADDIRQDLWNHVHSIPASLEAATVPESLGTCDVPVGDVRVYDRLMGVGA